MGMGGGQEQKAEELEHFPFCQGFGEELLWGEKDGQGASSSARSCWLPILSLLRGDVAVSLSSSVELACGPGDWHSEKEREASQGPTGWAKELLPSSLPPELATGQDLSSRWTFLSAITLAKKSGRYWCSAEQF